MSTGWWVAHFIYLHFIVLLLEILWPSWILCIYMLMWSTAESRLPSAVWSWNSLQDAWEVGHNFQGQGYQWGQKLDSVIELCRLLKAAEKLTENDNTGQLIDMILIPNSKCWLLCAFQLDTNGLFHLIILLIAWDGDMAFLLLLVNLLPPTVGRKRTKISPSDAVDKMLHFHKVCMSFFIQLASILYVLTQFKMTWKSIVKQ